ncbi:hypothetical protein EDC01DRAFT_682326 [Geopyxis carbonaria]|nr:hypothetical protein EDC01DRAFT_682326 [Geopyxis carbonaria]
MRTKCCKKKPYNYSLIYVEMLEILPITHIVNIQYIMANINPYCLGSDQNFQTNNDVIDEIDVFLIPQFGAGLETQEIIRHTALNPVLNFTPISNQHLYENRPYDLLTPILHDRPQPNSSFMAEDHHSLSNTPTDQSPGLLGTELVPQQPDTIVTLPCSFPDCKHTFSGPSAKTKLKRHTDAHNKPYRCKYKNCPRYNDGFTRKDNLNTHLRHHLTKKRRSGDRMAVERVPVSRNDELGLAQLRRLIRNQENHLEELREFERKYIENSKMRNMLEGGEDEEEEDEDEDI